MIVTEDIIAEKFAEYNRQYFDCDLPTPDFGLYRGYKFCGLFSCDKIIGRRYLKKTKIEISYYYDWNEDDLRDVLVHEMIHYYLAYKHIGNQITHGEAFHSMADEFNEKYGMNITERIDISKYKRAPNAPMLSWLIAKWF